MTFTIMTPEWRKIIDDMTIFVLKERIKDDETLQRNAKNKFALFNDFTQFTGTKIPDSELAIWCLNYLKILATMSLEKLKLAADLDELRY